MANPNNALGTNAAYGGRTSVNAFNDVLGVFSGRGILSGWGCEPNTGMTVVLGGNGEDRDVAIAEDNFGNRTTVNNISQSPIEVEISAAPSVNSRIDAIVAYVDASPQGSSSIVDNYGAVHLIDVMGTVTADPQTPDDNDIRSAITADGASGTTAYYVVLAYITVGAGTTDLTSDAIRAGGYAGVPSQNLDWATTPSAQALRARTTSDYIVNETSSTPTNNLPLSMVAASVGNAFSLNTSNRRVIVGGGVKYVAITASVYFASGLSQGELLRVHLFRNGAKIATNMLRAGAPTYATINIPRFTPIAVNRNDYFELRVSSSAVGAVVGAGVDTWLAIEGIA